jgi:tetratricopeptide (TPR) repeat protein
MSLSAEEYFDRGNRKIELKDYQGAINDFNKAINLNPHFTKAYFNRGKVKDYLGDHLGAIEDFNKVIEFNLKLEDAFNNRRVEKVERGYYESVIKDFTQAIKLNPKNEKAYYNRGTTKDKLGDYEGAIKDYNTAIELDPNYTDAYYNRGITKYLLNDIKGAHLDWIKAKELGSTDAVNNIKRFFSIESVAPIPLKILVADPNHQTTPMLLSRWLKYNEHVVCLDSGEEAIDKCRSEVFNLVISGIKLGRSMNGVEKCKRIKEIDGYKDIPVLAITAYGMKGDKEFFLQEGFDGYLIKPFERHTFIEFIKQFLPKYFYDYFKEF